VTLTFDLLTLRVLLKTYCEHVHYLSAGAKVNSTDSDRLTALHLAAQEGCVDSVKVLLEHSADVTALSRHGDTPLSLAARYGQSAAH